MNLIDVRYVDKNSKGLTAEVMNKFLSKINDNDDIIVSVTDIDFFMAYKKDTLHTLLDDERIKKYTGNDVFYITTEEVCLMVDAKDIAWYNVNSKRKAKFFKIEKTVEEKPKPKLNTEDSYKVEVGVKYPNHSIKNVVSMTGTKKECISFINDNIKKNAILTKNQIDTVVRLNDGTEWYTIDDLVKNGVATLQ